MRNVYYNEETKSFGVTSILDSKLQLMNQLCIHVFKLIYGFDYERDRDSHCLTLSTLAAQMQKVCKSDKELTKNGKTSYSKLTHAYASRLRGKELRKMKDTLIANYGFKGIVDDDEFGQALEVIEELLKRETKSERLEYLEEEFPPSDRRFSLMISRLTRNRTNSERKFNARTRLSNR